MPRLYSTEQVAKTRGVTPELVRQHAREGLVVGIRLGASWVFEGTALRSYRPVKRGPGRPQGAKDRVKRVVRNRKPRGK